MNDLWLLWSAILVTNGYLACIFVRLGHILKELQQR